MPLLQSFNLGHNTTASLETKRLLNLKKKLLKSIECFTQFVKRERYRAVRVLVKPLDDRQLDLLYCLKNEKKCFIRFKNSR